MLKNSVYHKNEMMEDVGKRVEEMDLQIEHYKSYIFTDENRLSKLKENKFLLQKGCKLNKLCIS